MLEKQHLTRVTVSFLLNALQPAPHRAAATSSMPWLSLVTASLQNCTSILEHGTSEAGLLSRGSKRGAADLPLQRHRGDPSEKGAWEMLLWPANKQEPPADHNESVGNPTPQLHAVDFEVGAVRIARM